MPARLRPCQKEMAKEYMRHRELFMGVARMIGTTTLLSGIATWELISKPGCVVAVDTDWLFRQIANQLKANQELAYQQTREQLQLSNGSMLIILPKHRVKGTTVDVMFLEPSTSWVSGSLQDFDQWFTNVKALLNPSTGKLLVVCQPRGPLKNLYKNWLSTGKPVAMFNYLQSGLVDQLGLDWFEMICLTPEEFETEFCCDFSIFN